MSGWDTFFLRFAAAAAAPWGCGDLWWSVMQCGVGCPAARLIHLKPDEMTGITHLFGTGGKSLSRGLVQTYATN